MVLKSLVGCFVLAYGVLSGGSVFAQSFSSPANNNSADDFFSKGTASVQKESSAASFFSGGSASSRADTGASVSGTAASDKSSSSRENSAASFFSGGSKSSASTSGKSSEVDAQPWKTNAATFAKPKENTLKNADVQKADETAAAKTENQKPVQKNPDDDFVNTGFPWNRTLDGTKRGSVGLYQKDGVFDKDNSFIFLYYDDFSVNRSLGGGIRCSVRFVVTTTLARKLNTLSVKLVWPEIETALNFYDVPPNTDVYFNYTLMGDGCYSMDKIPNIVVNRCRVAKMSAQECASKIKWLRKNK